MEIITNLAVEKIPNYFDYNMAEKRIQQSDVEKIRRIITRGKYGSIYFASSFKGFNLNYASKLLAAFEKEGLLVRISKGVYLKARKTRFGISYPPVQVIVEEIAKRDKAKVLPTGETAANLLGLSEQVPMKSCFLTSGTYRVLKFGHQTVLLKDAAPKNFGFKNDTVCILVQALKSIGKDNITEDIRKRIPAILADAKSSKYLDLDLLLAPAWIREIIYESLEQVR